MTNEVLSVSGKDFPFSDPLVINRWCAMACSSFAKSCPKPGVRSDKIMTQVGQISNASLNRACRNFGDFDFFVAAA